MKNILLLLCIPFIIMSCNFNNPVDNNSSQVETEITPGDDDPPAPGNNGNIFLNQRPGWMRAGFQETAEDAKANNIDNQPCRYRGIIAPVPLVMDTERRFNAIWNQYPAARTFYDYYDDAYPDLYYRDRLWYDFDLGTYTFQALHDSNKPKNLNVQAMGDWGLNSIYNNRLLKNVPVFDDAVSAGGSGSEMPQSQAGEKYGSVSCQVEQDSSDNIYIAFHYNDAVTLPGNHSIAGMGGNDIVVAKYNNEFEYQWHRKIQSAGDDQISELIITDNDEIFVSGFFRVNFTADEDPLYLDSSNGTQQILHQTMNREESFSVQYDTSGTIQQIYHMQSPTGDAYIGRNILKKVVTDNNGDRYLIGIALNKFQTVMPWTPAEGVQKQKSSIIDETQDYWFGYIIKESSAHDFISSAYFGFCPVATTALTTPTLNVSDAITDYDNNLYISGSFDGDFHLTEEDWGSPAYSPTSSANNFILKLFPDLNIWSHAQLSGDPLNSPVFLERTNSGVLLLIGSAGSAGNIMFQSAYTGSAFIMGMGGSESDIYMVALDSEFDNLGYTVMRNATAMTVHDTAVDDFGVLYIAGEYASTGGTDIFNFDITSYNAMAMPDSPGNVNSFLLAYALPDHGSTSLDIGEPHPRFIPGLMATSESMATSVSVNRDSIILGGMYIEGISPGKGFPDNTNSVDLNSAGLDDVYAVRMNVGNF